MAEEILQGLGLPNDSDDLKWSIFNDRNGLIWPGNYDWLLLSMLYAPELRPGMDHEIAASRLPAILDRIWPAYQIRRKKSRSN